MILLHSRREFPLRNPRPKLLAFSRAENAGENCNGARKFFSASCRLSIDPIDEVRGCRRFVRTPGSEFIKLPLAHPRHAAPFSLHAAEAGVDRFRRVGRAGPRATGTNARFSFKGQSQCGCRILADFRGVIRPTRSSLCTSRRPFGRSAIAASGSVAAIFKYASERSPQAPGNPNINHD
jgi:hypothetical protein